MSTISGEDHTDFGIAKVFTPSAFMTTSLQMGTPSYMAPEQKVDSAKVDARADIYAVGVVLFEMLTKENTIGPYVPSELNKTLPPEVDAIFKRAVALKVEERYQSVGELAGELLAIPQQQKKRQEQRMQEERERQEQEARRREEEARIAREREHQRQRAEEDRKSREAARQKIQEPPRGETKKSSAVPFVVIGIILAVLGGFAILAFNSGNSRQEPAPPAKEEAKPAPLPAPAELAKPTPPSSSSSSTSTQALPPLGTDSVRDPITGHEYRKVFLPRVDWGTAKRDVETRLGPDWYLATITNTEEQRFLSANFCNRSGVWIDEHWIGGHKSSSGWRWVTDEPWSYSNWAPNEPSGDGVHLGISINSGAWNDESMYEHIGGYIAERGGNLR